MRNHAHKKRNEKAGFDVEEGDLRDESDITSNIGGGTNLEGVELIDHHHHRREIKEAFSDEDEESDEDDDECEDEDGEEYDDSDEDSDEEEDGRGGGGGKKKGKDAGGTWFTGYTYADEAAGWYGNSGLHTPSHNIIHFYNLTNPAAFLAGEVPSFELVGPFTYRQFQRRTDVVFAKDGSYVDYTFNYKNVLEPSLTVGGSDKVNIMGINTAYTTGVARKLSESNMVRVGIPRVLNDVRDKSLPQLAVDLRALTVGGWNERPGDLATAAKGLQAAMGAEVFATTWAQGGFSKPETVDAIAKVLKVDAAEAAYIRGLLDTSKDLALPTAVAQRLWDPAVDASLVALNTPAANARKGLLLYAGPEAGRVALPTQLGDGATPTQVEDVAAYVRRILASPEVAVKVLDAVGMDKAKYPTLDDLAMRQFTMADVLSSLGGDPGALQGISLTQVKQGNTYVEEALVPGPVTEAVPMLELGYILRSAKTHPFLPAPPSLPAWVPPRAPRTVADLEAQGWGVTTKGKCIFDVVLSNQTYYENAILGVPAFKLEDEFTHLYARTASPLTLGGVQVCLAVGPMDDAGTRAPTPDWVDLQTYLNFIGKTAIEPLFRFAVINNNGGLVTTRTVQERVLGHQEPLLALSLGGDAPSARFALLPNAPGPLDGHAFCTSAADVDHTLFGCFLDTEASTPSQNVYRKTPSRYATGKTTLSDLSQLQNYAGVEEDVPVMYPSGQQTAVVMPDAVAELSSTLPTLTHEQRADDVPPLLLPVNTSLSPSALQRGFTTGEQFPPFLLQDLPDPPPLWVLRLKGPIAFRFSYTNNTERHGITLRRFHLAQDLFHTRDDWPLVKDGEGEGRRESTFMNLTLGTWMPTFIADSPLAGFRDSPTYAASSPLVVKRGKEMEGRSSFVDVEPTTGKTLSARMQAQVSVSTSSPLSGQYDTFYPEAYLGSFLPTVYMASETDLHAKDASTIRGALYTPGKVVKGLLLAAVPVGTIMCLWGLVLMGREFRRRRRNGRAK
ncbi:lysosome membrane protein 2 [Nannochloropsis oceanica]